MTHQIPQENLFKPTVDEENTITGFVYKSATIANHSLNQGRVEKTENENGEITSVTITH